jgi:hypothetical protein
MGAVFHHARKAAFLTNIITFGNKVTLIKPKSKPFFPLKESSPGADLFIAGNF